VTIKLLQNLEDKMADREKESSRKEKSTMFGSNFSNWDFNKMAEMMKKCCGDEEDAFDCSSMMKDMMKNPNGKPFDCCSMMEEMMNAMSRKPEDSKGDDSVGD
jgi:hypothetical protein